MIGTEVKKMPQKSVAFSVGSVRAKESTLLNAQDMEQLLNAGSEAEILRFLRDKGYGSVAEQDQNVDALLAAERDKLWAYIESIAADSARFDIFRIKQDYHNVKTILKGILGNRPYQNLLLAHGTVDPTLIETAVKEQRFALLPAFLKDTVQNAYKLLSETGDPQLADGCVEQAMLAHRLEMAQNSRLPLLQNYMEATVFYADVKIALRAARAQKSRVFLERALVFCDALPVRELLCAALSGEEAVLACLCNFSKYDAAEAAQAYKKSPMQFEKFVDEYLLHIAAGAKYVTLGEEVLLGYYLAKDAELNAVQMIAVGVRTGQAAQEIRERLRTLYD